MGNRNSFYYTDEEKREAEEKEHKEKINKEVCKALNIFGIFLWIVLGVGIGVMLSIYSIKEVTELHPSQHTFIDSVATGDNYITIGMNDTNRNIFYSTSKGTSMYPSLWTDSFEIYMILNSTSELKVGDVIAYQIDGMNNGIVHRIVKIGEDKDGFYVRTKGDNNLWKDEWKIRDYEIEGVLIGVVY